MTDALIFYTNPMSRGRIVRWMLEEVGEPYETEVVFYGDAMKSASYRAINPMGKVPALRHGDQTITECAAICAYLADAFPTANLAPSPSKRAAYYRWLFFAAGPVEAAVTNKALGFEATPKQSQTAGYGTFVDVMDTLEKAVSVPAFLTGDQFTAADLYLGSQIDWGLKFGTMDDRPAFHTYRDRITSRDAYHRANAIDDALMPSEV